MAQKLWRVVRACVELGPQNPIQQIHDQGAGGNCNVVRSSSALPLDGLRSSPCKLLVHGMHVSQLCLTVFIQNVLVDLKH